MPQEQSHTRERQHSKFREPRRYRVILLNDDFTTMDFVVMILQVVFFKSDEEAVNIMLDVHQKGSGVAGIYSYDIAMSKVEKATAMARAEKFPLRLKVAPED